MHAHTHAHAQTRTRTHAKQNRLKQNSGSNLISPRMKLEYYRLSPDGSCQITVFAFWRPAVRESFHGCFRSLSSPFDVLLSERAFTGVSGGTGLGRRLITPLPKPAKSPSWKVHTRFVCGLAWGTWLYGVHRTRRDGSSFLWHQPCQRCKYTTSVDIQKRAIKKVFTHMRVQWVCSRAENSAI